MSENERIADEIIELHDLEDNADVKYASGVRVSPKDSIIEALEAKDTEIAELKETISVLHNALMDEKAKTISTANAELKAEVERLRNIICYSCGEVIPKDGDRPECYCHDCEAGEG